MQHYDSIAPKYDKAKIENIVRFDLDIFLKVTEIKLEVKLAENT